MFQEKFSDGNSTDNFQHDLAEKTNEAVEEGKRDVENAKSAGQSYIEQAKLYTESMVATTQVGIVTLQFNYIGLFLSLKRYHRRISKMERTSLLDKDILQQWEMIEG